ncbi:primosomal protein N' [Corynebacterium sp. H128]|uniref:primosomal protein N' n=1 Tax=unclassified Corynebacterium TaxID=2624378 RepID=UPI003098E2C9
MPKTRTAAAHLPVARVLPLLGLAHLDRTFDYRVDTELDEVARPGVRLRIRFAGRLVDAILLERLAESDHEGQLAWLERVISPDIVYPPQTAALVEALCARYAGTRSDVIRSAIPARHTGAESADTTAPWPELGATQEPDMSDWASYVHGPSFVDAVLAGATARAAWQVCPGIPWERSLAALAAKTAIDGGGVLIVLPDQRDVDRLEQALREHVSAKQITVLTAALGPQARYRRFLAILHGQARIVIGTRSAAFAPVQNLRLAALMFDHDENLVDPRAPYPHAREVLTTQSQLSACALLLGGYSRSAETQLLVETGWAHDVVAARDTARRHMPRIRAVGDSDAELERDPRARSSRIPRIGYEAVRAALERGLPALVQTPRKGYMPTLSCGTCRAPARCRHCNGPIGVPTATGDSPGVITCRWCGRPELRFRCGNCGSGKIRAVVLGNERTAEELGRAFSGVKVLASGGSRILEEVPAGPAIVVATPGAEPPVPGGYGAALLLDPWALLGREDLRANEDALAKWLGAAALVQSHTKGGEVVVVADSALQVVQALVRWDPVWAARGELYQRKEVSLPPTVHMAVVDGPTRSVEAYLELLELPDAAEVLGPVDLPVGVTLPGTYDEDTFGPPQRYLVRVPLGPRNELGEALRAGLVARAALKDQTPLRVQVDPINIG